MVAGSQEEGLHTEASLDKDTVGSGYPSSQKDKVISHNVLCYRHLSLRTGSWTCYVAVAQPELPCSPRLRSHLFLCCSSLIWAPSVATNSNNGACGKQEMGSTNIGIVLPCQLAST